jgi:putative chitinase
MDNAVFGAALSRLWPHGNSKIPNLVPAMIASAPTVWAKYAVAPDAVIAIMMAEFSEECGCGTEVVEGLNYSAAALLHQWSRHFTPEQATLMQHQPRMIADQAYNGRMGNRPFTDDGWNFRGRGGSQVTGRDNYTRLAKQSGIDVVGNPDLVNAPATFLDLAVADFIMCGCMPHALANDFVGTTKALNGGLIGEGVRAAQWALWKHAMGVA